MKFHKEQEGPPCKSMENLLQQVADGSLTGIKKTYALAHAANCTHCGNFLARMKVTLETLKEAGAEQDQEEAVERLRERIKKLEALS